MTEIVENNKIGKFLPGVRINNKYLGKFFTILVENHDMGCTCSYCKGEHKIHYGLNIPPDWNGWNSWYVIKFFPRRYFRWTNSWFKFFRRSIG